MKRDVDACLAMERACRLALAVWEGRAFTKDDQIQAGLLAFTLKDIGEEAAASLGIGAKYPDLK